MYPQYAIRSLSLSTTFTYIPTFPRIHIYNIHEHKHKKEIKTFESNQRIALKKVKGTAGKGKKGKEILAL